MSLGVGVLISLFLLAPGLAFHAAVFPQADSKGIRFSGPAPNSMLSLSVVGFGAIASHSLLAILSSANDWFCDSTHLCLPVSFEPNIYETMLKVGEKAKHQKGVDVTAAIVMMLMLSIAAYSTKNALGRFSIVRTIRYGWLADIVDLSMKENSVITAFVLSTVQHDGSFLGYEGVVENLAINSDKEITSVTLLYADRFVISLGKASAHRYDVPRDPIPRLYIEKVDFKNIALTAYKTRSAKSA